MSEHIYPLTIIGDRYTGAYSGGKYTAWNSQLDNIPPAINGGDIECSEFWADIQIPVGLGETPDLALSDLAAKLADTKTPENCNSAEIYEYPQYSDSVNARIEKGNGCSECADGWAKIINNLDQRLNKTNPNYVIYQIKEKFGGLRFHTDWLSPEGYDLVSAAESDALKTCEYCGAKENVTTSGSWLKTLCPTCRKSPND